MALKDHFLTQISQLSKNIEHFANFCRFSQFGILTIVLIIVSPPKNVLLFQWAPIWEGCNTENRSAPSIFFRLSKPGHGLIIYRLAHRGGEKKESSERRMRTWK